MHSNEFNCFSTVKCYLEEEGVEIKEILVEEISQHLTGLSEAFNQYFPEEQVKHQNKLWIKNPFIVNARPSTMSAKEYETFIEIKSDSLFQEKLKSILLVEFWYSTKDECLQLS